MELDLEEQEPSVLDYARFYGLCTEHTIEPLCFDGFKPPSEEEFLQALKDPGDSHPHTDPFIELTRERLIISKDDALLLKAVQSLHMLPDEAKIIVDPRADERTRALSLKEELPLLRTDNELDLLHFGSIAVPSFQDLEMPLESIDVEKDEGFEWPSKYYCYPQETDRRIRAEKISVSRDDLLFLQNAVKNNLTSEDAEEIQNECLSYKRDRTRKPLTPPLFPLSPPMTPYIPSSPGNHLDLWSDESGSTAAELKALDDGLSNMDAIKLPSDQNCYDDPALLEHMLAQIESLEEIAEPPVPLPVKRKVDDLKVEGPLTPPIFPDSPLKRLKSVSFPELIHEYIPELPSTFESGDDILGSQDSFAEFFKPYATEAKRQVDSEKLSEVDTVRRVDIPEIDLRLPVAPWDEFSCSKSGKRASEDTELIAQSRFLLQIKYDHFGTNPSWHGITKLERTLTWTPFPNRMAIVKIAEMLHGEEVLNKMLAVPTVSDIATSSTDLWKRDGLRILEDEDDGDDEIDIDEFEEPTNIEGLIRKRRLELDDENNNIDDGHKKTQPQKLAMIHNKPTLPQIENSHDKRVNLSNERDSSLMFGGMFTAPTALQKFLHHHQGEGMQFSTSQSIVPIKLPTSPSTLRTPPQIPEQRPVKLPSFLPKLPPIPEDLAPCSFIISTTLLQHRSLTREVENIYKQAVFIERDFGLPPSPAQEADLLLSPSTGLMFTSLQQVKQRALPGQVDRSPIKERIFYLQSRYERLIILISEGLSKEAECEGLSRPVDSRDQEALNDFEKFTSNLEATVLFKYVRGGEMALSRQIVVEMRRWGLPHGSKDIGDIRLLQDETQWEIFLRRAGLNAFAAQVILAALKEPYDVEVSTGSPAAFGSSCDFVSVFGLQAFVFMEAEERIKRFQALLGGSRILSRVSAILDQQWPSAVHGFEIYGY